MDLSEKRMKWTIEQEMLKQRIITYDDFSWKLPSYFKISSPFIESFKIESNEAESNWTESNVIESFTIESNEAESNRIRLNAIESNEAEPIQEESILTKTQVIESNAIESKEAESNQVEKSRIESNEIDSVETELNRAESNSIKSNLVDSRPELKYIGGVDVSYVKENSVIACAALIITSLPHLNVCYEAIECCHVDEPYIPGFLAFREFPIIQKLIQKLKNEKPEYLPQIIFVDGNGILHPRGVGFACHLGIFTNIPTIGIGKTMHHVDGLNSDQIKSKFKEKKVNCGQYIPLIGESGRLWGAALRSSEESFNPIFLSIGFKISLSSAIRIVYNCCKFRLPEPLRQADIRSREFLRVNGY